MKHKTIYFLIAFLLTAGIAAGLLHIRRKPSPPCETTISEPGTYVLSGDCYSAKSPVIRIASSNVTIDLNGHRLECTPSDAPTAPNIGIDAPNVYDRITIRNGAISACFMGAKIAGHHNTIQNVDFTGNTYVGFNGGGRGNVITASTFENIGGYTREAYAIGINTPGTDCVIQANLFRNIYRQPRVPSSQAGEGVGLLIGAGQTGCTITHNFFKNDGPGHPVHTDVAAWVAVGASAQIRHNTIIGFPRGLIAETDQMSAEDNLIWLPFEGRNAYAIFPPTEQAARNVIIGYDAPPAKKPVTSPN